MTLQTQQSAELLRPFGQAVLVDAPQGRGVVRHDRHAYLHDRPVMPFVSDPRGTPAQQAAIPGQEAGETSSVPSGIREEAESSCAPRLVARQQAQPGEAVRKRSLRRVTVPSTSGVPQVR